MFTKFYQPVRIIMSALLLVVFTVFTSPNRVANAAGISVSFSNPACPINVLNGYLGTFTVTPAAKYTYTLHIIDLTNGQEFTQAATAFFSTSIFGAGTVHISSKSDIVVVTLTLNGQPFFNYPCGAPPVTQNFNDGRCNQEPWQSLTVYPDGKGGYNFYALYKSVGHFAMHITKQQLDTNPDKGTNFLIASNLGVSLYRMAGGDLMAARGTEDGKVYNFVIGSCRKID
jgi:hypothetical protein